MTHEVKADSPRRRAVGKPAKPTVSGQIEFSEDERLRKLIEETGRNRSYVTRAAILLLLKQHEAGLIDWSKGAEQW
jgi:hypothetical protein